MANTTAESVFSPLKGGSRVPSLCAAVVITQAANKGGIMLYTQTLTESITASLTLSMQPIETAIAARVSAAQRYSDSEPISFFVFKDASLPK